MEVFFAAVIKNAANNPSLRTIKITEISLPFKLIMLFFVPAIRRQKALYPQRLPVSIPLNRALSLVK